MKARQGLTLFEVVIALGIFLVSMSALYQLLNFTSERVIEIDQHSQASLYCQSKLAELTTGLVGFESVGWTAFDEDPDWFYRIDASPGDVDGLSSVQVAVKFGDADPPSMQVSLSQFLIEPKRRGSTLDQFGTTTPSTASSSSSGGTSDASSGSSSSGATSGASTSGTSGASGAKTGGGGTPSGGGTRTGGGGGTQSGAGGGTQSGAGGGTGGKK